MRETNVSDKYCSAIDLAIIHQNIALFHYLTGGFSFQITNKLENLFFIKTLHFNVNSKKVSPLKKAPSLVSECTILAFDPKGEK